MGAKYRLWALPVSARGVRQAGYEQMRTVESSLGAGGPALAPSRAVRRGTARRAERGGGTPAPRSGRLMDGLRALQEAGAITKRARRRPEVRWAYEGIVPAAVGLVLLTVLFTGA